MYEYEADVANFAKYFDIYNLMRISKGATADQLKKWLISEGMPETSARRQIKEFTEDYDGWLYEYDEETEEYTVSKYGMEYFIKKLAEWSEIKIYDQEAYDAGINMVKDKVKQLKDEIKEMEKNHLEMQALCHSQQKYIERLNASIENHQDKIVDLSTRLGLSEAKVNELESEKGTTCERTSKTLMSSRNTGFGCLFFAISDENAVLARAFGGVSHSLKNERRKTNNRNHDS